MTPTSDSPPLPIAALPVEPLVDRERANPWLRWSMHFGLPIGVSLLIHVTLFATLALQTWRALTPRDFSQGEFEAGLVDATGADIASQLNWPADAPLPMTDLNLPDARSQFDAADLTNLRDPDLSRVDPGKGGDDGGGFGVGDSGRSGVIGIGSGAGDGGGAGFGAGFGSGGGPGQAGLWDLRVAGNKFVYVIDFSGSIIVAVDELKRELKRSIGRLRPTQTFNVILFFGTTGRSEKFVTESFSPDMQPARAEVKRQFFEWIDRRAPMGSTEPLAAARRAISLRPDVIFFFSDGYFDEKVVGEIARANKTPRVRIHCLVFDEILLQDTSGLPRMTDGAQRLKRIAEENGGKLKVVTGADLKRN